MKTYKQKKIESHTLSSLKSTIADTVQFMRIRLNDDVQQNTSFDGILRNIKTSSAEVMKQLPRLEREKYTPKVVADEIAREKGVVGVEDKVELEDNEDIVFEGHGQSRFFWVGRTMEGKGAENLAEIVLSVLTLFKKTKSWHGRVFLLGCRTAPIVKPMAKLLKKQLGREINVIGTKKNIVGTGGLTPYAFYEGDKSRKRINFTDPGQVEMAYSPGTHETELESGFVMVDWDIDQMDIQEHVPQSESYDEVGTDEDFAIIGLSASEEENKEK